ncbi:hypothetical protein LCGC14_2067290 [marine sediment metagenome]|uniref:Uncharacterized protein n=1 Tax=marine sediment metagenome TaxID=412755 RepID=A0A0F9EJC3_9ZZZZ
MKVDINKDDVDIYAGEQLVLNISQTSDEETINLFFYPTKPGIIEESMMHEEHPDSECTHELLVPRTK